MTVINIRNRKDNLKELNTRIVPFLKDDENVEFLLKLLRNSQTTKAVPTQLARKLDMKVCEVNEALTDLGFQELLTKGRYRSTVKGLTYSNRRTMVKGEFAGQEYIESWCEELILPILRNYNDRVRD